MNLDETILKEEIKRLKAENSSIRTQLKIADTRTRKAEEDLRWFKALNGFGWSYEKTHPRPANTPEGILLQGLVDLLQSGAYRNYVICTMAGYETEDGKTRDFRIVWNRHEWEVWVRPTHHRKQVLGLYATFGQALTACMDAMAAVAFREIPHD